mmetsp:Transcript_20143/g.29530  ORF Transcript_20143/g.29530 Transcript_20143/m.29530 type:complete len:234 (+) Transcript_20143:93-794(+)
MTACSTLLLWQLLAPCGSKTILVTMPVTQKTMQLGTVLMTLLTKAKNLSPTTSQFPHLKWLPKLLLSHPNLHHQMGQLIESHHFLNHLKHHSEHQCLTVQFSLLSLIPFLQTIMPAPRLSNQSTRALGRCPLNAILLIPHYQVAQQLIQHSCPKNLICTFSTTRLLAKAMTCMKFVLHRIHRLQVARRLMQLAKTTMVVPLQSLHITQTHTLMSVGSFSTVAVNPPLKIRIVA